MNEFEMTIVAVACFGAGLLAGLLAHGLLRLILSRRGHQRHQRPMKPSWAHRLLRRRGPRDSDTTIKMNDDDATLVVFDDDATIDTGGAGDTPRRGQTDDDRTLQLPTSPGQLSRAQAQMAHGRGSVAPALQASNEEHAAVPELEIVPFSQPDGYRCRMLLPNGQGIDFQLGSGFTWAVADTKGLATDMHVRIAPGGTHFVSVRDESQHAYLALGEDRIQLSAVEIPWRGGWIVNGSLQFERIPSPAPAWDFQLPVNPTAFRAASTDSCIAVTRDQPHLAVLAANLYVPGGVDAVDAWRERLRLYLARLKQPPAGPLLLVALGSTGLTCSGNLVQEIGLGRPEDSVPGTVREASAAVQREVWQRRLWIPTAGGEQRWHWDSFVVTLPELVPESTLAD